jgi:hypothetical protein
MTSMNDIIDMATKLQDQDPSVFFKAIGAKKTELSEAEAKRVKEALEAEALRKQQQTEFSQTASTGYQISLSPTERSLAVKVPPRGDVPFHRTACGFVIFTIGALAITAIIVGTVWYFISKRGIFAA